MPREKDLWFGCLIYFFRKRSENINFRAFGQRNFPRKNIFFRTEFFSQKNLPYGRKLSKMFSAEQIFFPHGKCNQIAKHSKIPFWRFSFREKIFFPHGIFFSKKSSIRKKIIKIVFRGTEVFAARKKNLLPSGKTFRALRIFEKDLGLLSVRAVCVASPLHSSTLCDVRQKRPSEWYVRICTYFVVPASKIPQQQLT